MGDIVTLLYLNAPLRFTVYTMLLGKEASI